MTGEAWQIIWFTAWASALATLLIIPPGLAIAWLLARRDWPGKSIVETLISLPLVIPPVATGLILLKLFGRRGPLGSFLENNLHLEIIFTWKAVLLSLMVMSFPLFVRSARAAMEGVNPRLEQIARTLGANGWRVFFTITAPLAMRGILAGVLLGFARALGEFGATIMVAGNIAGETTTISLSIYQSVQLGDDRAAWTMLGFSVTMAFAAVWTSEWLLRREKEKRS
ncbi:MAG TPA: molybdate ABC transporter permease subunit [Verrucomicrobiae bacterium]